MQSGEESVSYHCRCSFLEIYNEIILDLLNPVAANLQIREDAKRGCYVDGLSEQARPPPLNHCITSKPDQHLHYAGVSSTDCDVAPVDCLLYFGA